VLGEQEPRAVRVQSGDELVGGRSDLGDVDGWEWEPGRAAGVGHRDPAVEGPRNEADYDGRDLPRIEETRMQAPPVPAAVAPFVALALPTLAAIVAIGTWVAVHPDRVVAIGGGWRSRPWIGRVRRRLEGTGWPGMLAASALILLVGVVLLVLVSWTLGALTRTEAVVRLDRPVFGWFVEHRESWLTAPMSLLTGLGGYTATMLFAVVVGVGLAAYQRHALPLLLLIALPVEKYLQQLVASLVDAPQPPAALSIGPAGTFPSGGSARVVLVYGMAAWLLARRLGWWPAVAGWTVVALLAFAEGYSRLYLGRHWVVDVLGGWAFGALLLAVLLLAATTLIPRPSGHAAGTRDQ
jgi:membrane-associated phospholipid phosphatase